jgi:hypothetical protein
MEILIALGIAALVAVNAPVETKAPQEIKSTQTSVEVVQPVKPKAKPKKKAVKKVVKADPAKQQPSKESLKVDSNKQPATKETAKAEPVKKEPPATVSSPEQKSNQSNLLYYILGIITLGLVSAYFYFRKGGQTADTKIYSSDELKQSLQQDSDKFKYQPPEPKTIIEPQSQSSIDPTSQASPEPQSQTPSSDQPLAEPKPDDEGKKS